MLDFKALSVRQVFKTFARAETYLKTHYTLSQLSEPDFYLSSSAKMNLLEDLIDIYLGYLYDKTLKHTLICELVQSVWNSPISENELSA